MVVCVEIRSTLPSYPSLHEGDVSTRHDGVGQLLSLPLLRLHETEGVGACAFAHSRRTLPLSIDSLLLLLRIPLRICEGEHVDGRHCKYPLHRLSPRPCMEGLASH